MTNQPLARSGIPRWLKFNAVGAGGIAVQLAILTLLKSVTGLNYIAATAMAVEGAILHNYFWHERYTWLDRPSKASWLRFLKFNFTTGMFSILGNVVLMRCFVSGLHVNYVSANVMAIASCSLVNFLVSDHFVFEAD